MSATRLSAITLGLVMTLMPVVIAAQPANTMQPGAPIPASSASQSNSASGTGWTQAPEAQPAAPLPSDPAPAAAPPAPPASLAVEASAPAPVPQASPAAAPLAPPPPVPTTDEPPTLFSGRSIKVGGYGGVGVHYARIRGEDGVLTGVEGALLLDHRFAIGLAGYSWANQQHVPAAGNFLNPYLHYGYGGLLIRYHIYIPNSPVYVSAAALIGGGVIGLTNTWDGDLYRENSDTFFVCEPELGVHVNFTRWMRAGLDAGYRIHAGVGKFGYTESDFNGISLGGNLQFGWF